MPVGIRERGLVGLAWDGGCGWASCDGAASSAEVASDTSSDVLDAIDSSLGSATDSASSTSDRTTSSVTEGPCSVARSESKSGDSES